MVFKGLIRYGFEEEARELGFKTKALFEVDIAACGERHEYYDPETGKPIINQGFQNWNMLTVNMCAWLNGDMSAEEF